MIREEELYKLKKGDKVLVECTVEAVFVESGLVMVTTKDCDGGFDAYIDEVQEVVSDTSDKCINCHSAVCSCTLSSEKEA